MDSFYITIVIESRQILICFCFVFSLASSSAAIAIPALGGFAGGPNSPIDSALCDTLLYLGDHIVQEEAPPIGLIDPDDEDAVEDLALYEAVHREPSLVSRVSAHFKMLLRKAYAEINCLDDNAIVLSYLNGGSPYDYPDQSKWNKALLLFPSNELIELEYQRFSRINSSLRSAQPPFIHNID